MLYTGLVLYCWSNSVKSQAGLGLSGVFLVIITVGGGLGASALIGIPFNPTTTQILPFIALGTGVNAMFIMTQTYAELLQSAVLPEEVSFFPYLVTTDWVPESWVLKFPCKNWIKVVS